MWRVSRPVRQRAVAWRPNPIASLSLQGMREPAVRGLPPNYARIIFCHFPLAGWQALCISLLAEMRSAAVELAGYASYAEIVGAVQHNRAAVRKWCDEVFRLNRAIEDAEEANAHPNRTGEAASARPSPVRFRVLLN